MLSGAIMSAPTRATAQGKPTTVQFMVAWTLSLTFKYDMIDIFRTLYLAKFIVSAQLKYAHQDSTKDTANLLPASTAR